MSHWYSIVEGWPSGYDSPCLDQYVYSLEASSPTFRMNQHISVTTISSSFSDQNLVRLLVTCCWECTPLTPL